MPNAMATIHWMSSITAWDKRSRGEMGKVGCHSGEELTEATRKILSLGGTWHRQESSTALEGVEACLRVSTQTGFTLPVHGHPGFILSRPITN
jgi:hypothetical protein